MKYAAAQILALAGVSSALPHPRFSLPAFSMPSFSLPTGGYGSGSGSSPAGTGLPAFSIPSFPIPTGGYGSGSGNSPAGTGLPSFERATGSGFDWSSLIGGFGGGLGRTKTTRVQVTATPTATGTGAAASATTGNTGGTGTIGADCTPQGSSSGEFGSTENGVKDKNCCTDMTVIFARGTGESGNVGTVTGPPMFKAIRSKLGNDRVTVQGVDYEASSAGNANLGADGGKIMAQLVQTALTQCPNTKIIVSGFSQGAMVVHNAFSTGLKASQVAGAVQFGDPLKRQAIGDLPANKIKQFCGTSDQICGGGGDGGATGDHISYGSSADAAATFAIQAAGLA